jgi:hypothetical protein
MTEGSTRIFQKGNSEEIVTVKGILGLAMVTVIAMAAVPAAAQFIPGVTLTPEISVSTLGIGPELDAKLSELPFGLRVGGNFYSLTRNVSSNDIEYRGKADLQSGALTADWYPFFSGLRLSGGIRLNGNKATVDALPDAGGTITVNHVAYSTAGSSVNGQVTFRDIAPYAGLGYSSTLFGGLTLGVDLGAMFQGTPRVSLAAQGQITQAPGFGANLAQETQSLQDKVRDFSIYPVAEISVGWRF